MNDFDFALTIHGEIEALYPEIAEKAAVFRGLLPVGRDVPKPGSFRAGVDRDRMLCSLAIKAATTKRAIVTLCRSGDGDSAYTLARTILENGVLMKWLVDGPSRVRLETYCLFTSVTRERAVNFVRDRYANRPDVIETFGEWSSDPYHRAVADAVFGGKEFTFAFFPNENGKLIQTSIREIFEQADEEFAYRSWYFDGCQYVHSGPDSLMRIGAALSEKKYFELGPMPQETRIGHAVTVSNAAMLLALAALDDYVGVGLESKLLAIRDRCVDYAKSTFSSVNVAPVEPSKPERA